MEKILDYNKLEESFSLSGVGSDETISQSANEEFLEMARSDEMQLGGDGDDEIELRCGDEEWHCHGSSAWDYGYSHANETFVEQDEIPQSQYIAPYYPIALAQPQYLYQIHTNDCENQWKIAYDQLGVSCQNRDNYWQAQYERKKTEYDGMVDLYNRLVVDKNQLEVEKRNLAEELLELKNSSESTVADLKAKLNDAHEVVELLSGRLEDANKDKNFLLKCNVEATRIFTTRRSTVDKSTQVNESDSTMTIPAEFEKNFSMTKSVDASTQVTEGDTLVITAAEVEKKSSMKKVTAEASTQTTAMDTMMTWAVEVEEKPAIKTVEKPQISPIADIKVGECHQALKDENKNVTKEPEMVRKYPQLDKIFETLILRENSKAKVSELPTERDDADPDSADNETNLESQDNLVGGLILLAANHFVNEVIKPSDSGVSNVTSDEDEGDEQQIESKKKKMKSKARKQKEKKNKKAQAKKGKGKKH